MKGKRRRQREHSQQNMQIENQPENSKQVKKDSLIKGFYEKMLRIKQEETSKTRVEDSISKENTSKETILENTTLEESMTESKFYKKRWVRITAASIAIIMLITTVYVSYGTGLSIQAAERRKEVMTRAVSPEEAEAFASQSLELAQQITLLRTRTKNQPEQAGGESEEEAKLKEQEAIQKRQSAMYEEAVKKEEELDYQRAYEIYTQLIDDKETYDKIFYICRARCSFYMEDYEGLLEDCSMYEQDQGADDDGSIHYLMAVSLMYLERYEEAKECMDFCIDSNDTMEEVYFYRGICYMATGCYEEATADFAKSIERGELIEESQENKELCLEQMDIIKSQENAAE